MSAPRNIEAGLAAACNHTDLVGLGVRLLQNRTVKGAQTVLASYDFTLGKAAAKAIPASFSMDGYQTTASLARKSRPSLPSHLQLPMMQRLCART